MRPQEILGLVEEAAGTRMYEERKDKAKKTMDKKDKRVQEITSLLNEEITPKLDTLREEKRSYLTYQKAVTELEKLSQLLRAWEWKEATERVKRKDADAEKKQAELLAIQADKARMVKEIDAAEKERKDAVKRREKVSRITPAAVCYSYAPSRNSQKAVNFRCWRARPRNLRRLSPYCEPSLLSRREPSRTRSAKWLNSASSLPRHVLPPQLDEVLTVRQLTASLAQNKQRAIELAAAHNAVKQKHAAAETALSNSEELLQTLITGLSSSNSLNTTGGGYLGQLAEAKARVAAATTEEEQAKRKLQLSEKELVSLQAKWKKVEAEASDGTKQLDKLRKEIEGLQRKRVATGWSEEKEGSGVGGIREARDKVRGLTMVSGPSSFLCVFLTYFSAFYRNVMPPNKEFPLLTSSTATLPQTLIETRSKGLSRR